MRMSTNYTPTHVENIITNNTTLANKRKTLTTVRNDQKKQKQMEHKFEIRIVLSIALVQERSRCFRRAAG